VYVLDARKLSAPIASLQCLEQQPVQELAWQLAHRSSRRHTMSAGGTGLGGPTATSKTSTAAAAGGSIGAGMSGVSAAAAAAHTNNLAPVSASSATSGMGNLPSSAAAAAALAQAEGGVLPPALASAAARHALLSQHPTPDHSHASGGSMAPALHQQYMPPLGLTGLSDTPSPALQPQPHSVASDASGAAAVAVAGRSSALAVAGRSSGADVAGAATGRTAALLGETTFKSYMDDAVSGLRDELRNLHIDMVRQFHLQQVRSKDAKVGEWIAGQDLACLGVTPVFDSSAGLHTQRVHTPSPAGQDPTKSQQPLFSMFVLASGHSQTEALR
jgi:hypothetical protein